MDKIDKTIIELLRENARIANSDIAKHLGMAPSAIWERIKKLEDNNVIQRYCAIINPISVDLNILAYVTISVNSANWSDTLAMQLQEINRVEELHEVIGEDSYLIKVRVKDMEELSEVLKNKIGVIPEISATKTVIAVKSLKEDAPYQLTKV